ncbi:methyltransferase-like protein 25B isoform X3 [Parasteatoda tepidariorum]|uniref:methyltransferase-like protein 25B isoform X3 n=1 Tax=Parasteatoda tepidariorum TaxID=114398 RepID=UPI0039BCA760
MKKVSQKPWPLSLLSIRACISSLSLYRKSIISPQAILNFLTQTYKVDPKIPIIQEEFSSDNDWSSSVDEFNSKSCQHKKIPSFCRRHVKPKKQHEIFRIAKVTDIMLSNFNLKNIIDIGSGLGHLSRFLNLTYNFNVTTVEANHHNVSGAVALDKQAFCSLKKLKKETPDTLPHHVKECMKFTSSDACLKKVISETCFSSKSSSPEFALLGLHTCGSLAETVLKSFVDFDESKILILVGCCYMKKEPGSETENYPLSSFVKSLPNHELSYEAKELACHAIEMYIKRLQDNASSLKIHCYRAALEKCIVSHYPSLKHLGLRGVKHAECLAFHEYAEQALCKVDVKIPKETLLSQETVSLLSRWKEVLTFYSLRLIIAPVIETLILMDRLLYLYEKGCPCCVAPVFDPTLSPRNFVLLSVKVNKDGSN